jgi:RHS repeat-associated protein
MTYTLRGHLESMVVKDSTGNAELDSVVQYKWYPSGALQQLTFPDGSYLHYTYNEAGHLTEIRNNIDEKITFEPNAVGDWVEARTLDASSEVKRLQVRAFDELSRLLKDISPFGEETVFGYDANGNPILRTDATNQSWQSSYDALNRLAAQIDPKAGEVKYKYDVLDRLTKVTDQNDLSTDYQYDAFGNRTLQISPDTGTTDYDYDAAGNLIHKTDARGVVSAYQYDALNRLVAITYPSFPEENVQYQYDLVSESSAGIGRLGRIADLSGETEYSYDARANITSKQSLVEAQPYVVTYRYDLSNRLVGLTYPSGRAVRYERDEQGRISRIQTQSNVTAPWVTLIDQLSYQPFGGVLGFTYGNGLNQDVDYDLAYRLTGITTQGLGPVLNRQYHYDVLNNIRQIDDAVAPAKSQSFVYDELSRLIDAEGGYGALSYQYDAVGNRLSQSKTSGSQNLVETYSYATDSHRLQQVTEQSGNTTRTRTLQHDANGNLINDQRLDGQQLSLHYNGSNRLSEVDESTAPLASYRHNALGQRVAKVATDPAQDEHYVYDEQGQLLMVAHRADGTMTHYVYLDQQRIAMIKEPSADAEIYYLHNDHLGTPQVVTDQNRNVVWQGEYSPFGELVSQSGSLSQPLRFPGQHADPETGLYYNYFRDYDPSLGRYIQSDPIGLRGGVNTYGYALQNPVLFFDPYGLYKCAPGANCDFTEVHDQALMCLETCLGRELTVTSGRRGKAGTTSHSKGQASDIGENQNKGICRDDYENCFKKCFPNGAYGQQEYNSGNEPGTHYHNQTNEGRGSNSSPSFAPGIKGHTNHDK